MVIIFLSKTVWNVVIAAASAVAATVTVVVAEAAAFHTKLYSFIFIVNKSFIIVVTLI